MTAASGADQPTLRDQLAEQLATFHPRFIEHDADLLDVLLPLIEADRERAKAEALQPVLDLADEWEAGMRAMGYRDGHHDGARAIRAALRGSP